MSNNYFAFKQFTIFQDRCTFKVGTDGVLLGACAQISAGDKILDIGTGSGLIALMLAQKGGCEITAIEPDPDSYKQALENISGSRWKDMIRVENTTLQRFKEGGAIFNLIVSNPPYFNDSLKNPDLVKASTRHNDSLSTDDLLEGVSELLKEDGRFLVILPYVEGNIFLADAARYKLYCNSILRIRPLPTSDVRRLILSFSRKRTIVAERFLTIERGDRHEFTDDYINLTKDYYLKF